MFPKETFLYLTTVIIKSQDSKNTRKIFTDFRYYTMFVYHKQTASCMNLFTGYEATDTAAGKKSSGLTDKEKYGNL